MPRSTTTTPHAYGVDREASFGDLLLKCLTFPKSEIEADAQRAIALGIQPATPETVALARKHHGQQKNGLRLKLERQRAKAKVAA